MASMRSVGVVGVVSSTSSRPAAVATCLTGPVSSKGMSGTKRPAKKDGPFEVGKELESTLPYAVLKAWHADRPGQL